MIEQPHDPVATDDIGAKIRNRFGDTGEFAALTTSMRRPAGADGAPGERLSVDQWIHELRLDPTTAPALFTERRDDIDGLKLILRRLIQENRPATAAAAHSLGRVVPEHVDAMVACVLDPSLGQFSSEVIDAANEARGLPAATRALLNAVGKGRRNHDARHVLTIALNTLQRAAAPLADYEDFFTTSQELLRYPDLHGRYLLAVLSQSPVTILPHHDDFVALWRSLNAQSAGTMSSVRPILTYKLSKARDDISRSGSLGWAAVRGSLRIAGLEMPADDYRAYVAQAFQLLIDSKLDMVEDSSLYDTLASEAHADVFVDEFCRYLDHYRADKDLYGSAASVIVAFGERSQFNSASQRPASRIVRHVGGSFRSEIHTSMKPRYPRKSPGADWWSAVYRNSSGGLAGLLGR